MSEEYGWYVVQTKPRNEYRAKTELSNQEYECFLPEMPELRQRKGRNIAVMTPLFPRYLFVRLSRVRNYWHPIRSTRGVTCIVAFGNSDPLKVTDQIVKDIRSGCCEASVQPHVKSGDRVRIGPLDVDHVVPTAFWGQFVSMGGRGRAIVVFSLLGREHKVEIAADRLTLD